MDLDLPRLVRDGGRSRLLVGGHPFLILGLQWGCDSCFSAEEMNSLFPHARRMGANTAVLPVYWCEVEPEPGRYCFARVDERVRQAQTHGLRAILLWFATWKNGCAFYAPEYIRADPATYRPAVDPQGRALVSLCPLGEATWQRDRDALVALMAHLRQVDSGHTVIMIQIENEPGIMGSDRCYCPACNARFAAEGWQATYGVHAAEAFSAVSVARYIDRLAAEAKAAYPLPMYTNVWLAPEVGGIAGRDYPSGGAVPAMLDLFWGELSHLDLVAPDIYRSGYRDFRSLCQAYGAGGRPLFIAEHSSSPAGRAERNVFYAVGKFGALGFDPWAIDSPHPERFAPPLVDPVGGEWGPQAYALRDSYVAIGRAMRPIVEAQGTRRLFTLVQEPGEEAAGWEAEGCDVLVTYDDPQGAGRGLMVQQSAREFLLIGSGYSVRFRRPRPDGRPVPVLRAEWGRYDGDRWVCLHPMRRERPASEGHPLTLLEPGVARVILDIGNDLRRDDEEPGLCA